MTPIISRKLKAYKALKQIAALVDVHYPHLREATLTEIMHRLSPARHSDDFHSVFWFGTHYYFNSTEAAIVAELWKAWERGTPKVGAGRLLSASDMISDRVSEVFKRNAAWGAMVQTDGRGTYWLAAS